MPLEGCLSKDIAFQQDIVHKQTALLQLCSTLEHTKWKMVQFKLLFSVRMKTIRFKKQKQWLTYSAQDANYWQSIFTY